MRKLKVRALTKQREEDVAELRVPYPHQSRRVLIAQGRGLCRGSKPQDSQIDSIGYAGFQYMGRLYLVSIEYRCLWQITPKGASQSEYSSPHHAQANRNESAQ